MLLPRAFIGQGTAGGKEAGMKQREQEAVLQQFRSGEVNVLVATCIGEEGLDVPQVGGARWAKHCGI